MRKSDSGNLLVKRIFRMWYAQTPPNLCGIFIERQDFVRI